MFKETSSRQSRLTKTRTHTHAHARTKQYKGPQWFTFVSARCFQVRGEEQNFVLLIYCTCFEQGSLSQMDEQEGRKWKLRKCGLSLADGK